MIIKEHNKVIGSDDIVLMLGDFSFNRSVDKLSNFVSRLKLLYDIIGITSAPNLTKFSICSIVFSNVQNDPVRAKPIFTFFKLKLFPPLYINSYYIL